MQRPSFVLAAGLLVLGNGLAFARDEPPYTTTAEADAYCSYEEDVSEFSDVCQGFIRGAVDAIVMFAGENICLPEYVPPNTLIRTVRSYVTDHPKLLLVPAATVIYQAMLEAYPCLTRPKYDAHLP